MVKTRLTAEGLRLLGELDAPVYEMHRRQLGHIPAKQLRQLSKLLERARERNGSSMLKQLIFLLFSL